MKLQDLVEGTQFIIDNKQYLVTGMYNGYDIFENNNWAISGYISHYNIPQVEGYIPKDFEFILCVNVQTGKIAFLHKDLEISLDKGLKV